MGEIDIIARENSTLVFVEVRYRRQERLMSPMETLDQKKLRRLTLTATHYLQSRGLTQEFARIDLLTWSGLLDKHATPLWLKNVTG
jgi:putative endonuclease